MVYYELKVHGDDLLAILCEPVDEYGEGTSDGYEADIFKGNGVFQFFKNMGDNKYEPAWCQSLRCVNGRVILPLQEIECLSSDTPIDRFSWETDENVCQPLHRIILKSNKQAGE